MGLDNFEFASSAFDRWLRYNPQQSHTAMNVVPGRAAEPTSRRIRILDTAGNRELLERLLNAGWTLRSDEKSNNIHTVHAWKLHIIYLRDFFFF